VLAQTTTDCNPLNSTCPDDPALGTTFSSTFNGSMSEFDPAFWNVTAGTSLISFGDDGVEMALQKDTDSVTVKSNFYIFWGQAEILFKAAKGTGIISTMILLSDDLDEVDWEIKGGNTTTVSNNYYGWGNVSQYNSEYPTIDTPAMDDYHNYTIDWTQERIQYIINGNVVRTVGYQEPGEYPQTPSRVQFGVWCGGCSKAKGTVEWAGGKTDFDEAPFTMTVKSIRITDGTTNSSVYSYGDHTGSYQSIKVTDGESDAYKAINKKSHFQSAEQKWNGLSTGAKIGIACGVLGAFAIALIAFTFYCCAQRKKGRAEKEAHDKEWEQQENEL
ncbi:glycoside hydrolase family 16 protein, partial [Pseudocercospora fijiensis CIRAD86]